MHFKKGGPGSGPHPGGGRFANTSTGDADSKKPVDSPEWHKEQADKWAGIAKDHQEQQADHLNESNRLREAAHDTKWKSNEVGHLDNEARMHQTMASGHAALAAVAEQKRDHHKELSEGGPGDHWRSHGQSIKVHQD